MLVQVATHTPTRNRDVGSPLLPNRSVERVSVKRITDERIGRQSQPNTTVNDTAPIRAALRAMQEARAGIFPCNPDTKRPLTHHGFKDASRDEEQVRAWWRKHPEALVGVPTGTSSGLLVIDVDPRSGSWFADNRRRLGTYRLHQTRRGKHLLYRYDPDTPLTNNTGQIARGVDVRSEGGYIIWWPAHGGVGTGEPGALPAWLAKPARKLNGHAPQEDPGEDWAAEYPRVVQALAQLDPDMSHDEWRDVAAALSHGSNRNTAGEDLFVEFSCGKLCGREASKFPGEAQVRKKYRSFANEKVDNVTLATLYQMAKDAGGRVPPGRPERPRDVPAARIITRAASDITPEPIAWLWEGQQARGVLQLIAGDGGQAKSTLVLDFAARISRGADWPDGSKGCTPGTVLIWNGEDSAAQTIVPRLRAAGADLKRVHFLHDVKEKNARRPFDPATDMAGLYATVAKFKHQRSAPVRYLIVDPIVSALEGGRDSNTGSHVSKSLEPLARLAEDLDIGIIGVHHFSKNPPPGAKLVHMVTGSHVFGTKPRIVHCAMADQSSADGTRLWILAKINNGKAYGAWRYRVQVRRFRNERGQWIETTRIEWLSWVEGTPEEISMAAASGGDTPKAQRAALFLEALLASGPQDYAAVEAAATRLEISPRTLARAKAQLGIESVKTGGRGVGWAWKLPENKESQATENQ